jgi:diketogulonate reductase-like aldo/keto reductase
MKQIWKVIALCMAVVLLTGSFSGQSIAEAKSSRGKVTLKVGKTNFTKRTCQLVKGQKVSVKVKTSNLTGKKITYSSSHEKIVSVSLKGRIHAKKKGTAKIKVVVANEKKKMTSWLKIKVVNKAKSPKFDFKKKTVKLNSGYSMPLNGIGTYSLEGDECVKSVSEALKRGVRLIDTAYMYDNEREVGKAVRESGIPREKIFVTTKLYPDQYDNPEKAINDSLKRLNIDYIDLLLLHHPGENDVKAYKAMEKAVRQGKVRSIGLSNWYIEELQEFLPQVSIIPAVVQNEIHPYYQESKVIDYVHSLGIVMEGWYPFGGRGYTKEMLSNKTIAKIAKAHGKSVAQVILRWNLQKGVVVIPGSSNPAHIQENTEIYDFQLSKKEMKQINALNRDEKHDWY